MEGCNYILKFTHSVLNRAAKLVNQFNNFQTSDIHPGSVLDKFNVKGDDKNVKNKKEIFNDNNANLVLQLLSMCVKILTMYMRGKTCQVGKNLWRRYPR